MRRWQVEVIDDGLRVSVALPSIQKGLGTGAAGVQWVVSGYALTFGLALVPAGRIGDALGRRRMFLIALTAFVVCSAAVGAAPSTPWLVGARLAQGLAAGALAPHNSALIQQLFRGAERGRAFGFFGATLGISTAVGPVVGGLILALAGEETGWRWIFFVNVPIGVVALVLAARGRDGKAGHLDPVGAVLLGAGVLALLLPLVQGESGGITQMWWLFVVGAGLIAAFVAWERRVVRGGREPVVDPALFTSTAGYASGAALGAVYFAGFSGIWLVFAMFFQNGLGYTPLQSGLAVTPFAIGSAVSAVLAGRMIERFGRRLTVAGLTAVVVGLVATAVVLWLVPGPVAGFAAALPLLLGGIGGGLVVTPNVTLTLRAVPVRMAGSAGGALQTGLFYGVLGSTGRDFPVAVGVALGGAAAWIALALVIAVVELRRDRRRDAAPAPDERPRHLGEFHH